MSPKCLVQDFGFQFIFCIKALINIHCFGRDIKLFQFLYSFPPRFRRKSGIFSSLDRTTVI